MVNAFFVVWRESLEAMLVIGVLLAWIGHQEDVGALRGRLWIGVGAGIGLAFGLASLTYSTQTWLQGESLDLFQTGMVFLACVLMTQMVLWMRRHGASMKRELEAEANRARDNGGWGIALVAALAIGREGMETVIFLAGMTAEKQNGALATLLGMAATGLGGAMLTAWLVARGARFLSYRTVFRVSEVLLFITALSLLGNGIDRLIGLDILPALVDSVWDSSMLLSDGDGAGRVLADFAGYRSQPSAALLIAYLIYLIYIAVRMRAPATKR